MNKKPIEEIANIARAIYGEPFSNTRISQYLGINIRTFQRFKTGEYNVQPYHITMVDDLATIPKYSISEGLGEDDEVMLHHNHFPHFFATIRRNDVVHSGASVKVDDRYVITRVVWLCHTVEEAKQELLLDAAEWLRQSGFRMK